MPDIDEAAVEVFMADVAEATPRMLTRCAIALEGLVQRNQRTPAATPIRMGTLLEAQRRLRAVLIAEP